MNREEEVTALWEEYEKGKRYQSQTGLSTKIPSYVRFFEGDQWPPPTKHTKNLPRPVVNFIKMICRNKKSAILATPVKLVYTAEEEGVDAEKFNRFAATIQKELGQETLDKAAVQDGVVKGSYFYHYYWDAEARGAQGLKSGALRGEIIDVLNIFFANPAERDEQKQKWIIISSREDISAVRAKRDADVDPDSITSDTAEDGYRATEQDSDRFCTVLTKYFRQNGEVFCEKATRNTIVNKPFPIAPDVEAALRELEEDAPNNSLPDDPRRAEKKCERLRAPLYPIVAGSYEPRNRSIYGIGEVEGLIPNQKSVNFLLAMSLLNAQETAWGKYIVLPGALGGQTITNEPGQVLVDHSQTGSGIRKMTEQTMQTMPIQLVDMILQSTRSVTGTSEIMTGETVSSGMSGAAIAQLQSQALLPTAELKEAFWLVKEKQGRVLAQFFRLFYHHREFSYRERVPKLNASGMPMLNAAGDPMEEEKQIQGCFESREYADTAFEVTVEATSGTKASAAGDINILDTLFAKGAISLKTYLNAYPKDALSNKSEILKGIEADEQDVLGQLRTQNEQLSAQLAQYGEVIEKQNETVADIAALIRENNELKTMLAQVYTEAREKILAGNAALRKTERDASEFAQDATDFAHAMVEEAEENEAIR